MKPLSYPKQYDDEFLNIIKTMIDRLLNFTDYIKSSVPNLKDLPSDDPVNTLRAVLNENKVYRFNGTTWELFQYIDLSLVGNLENIIEEVTKVFRSTRGTQGSEEAVNTIIGYIGNDVANGTRGAHVQQGSYANENVIGGDPSTIGEYAVNKVNPDILNAHYSAAAGYDNVVNSLASFVYSMHSYVAELATHGSIFGGSFHKILDGDYSGIFAGTLNFIYGTDGGSYSVILAGYNNKEYGKYLTLTSSMQSRIGFETEQKEFSGIYNSYLSTVDGNYASVRDGNECKATKDYSTARGKGAVANNVGESVFSTGKFNMAGDSGQSTMHLMRQSTTGIETQLLADDSGSAILTPIGVNTILKVRGHLVGYRMDADGGASFSFEAVLYRGSGKLELKSLEIKKDWSSDDLYNMNIVVNSTVNSYQVRAKGVNGHVINWSCKLDTVWSRNI